VVDPAFIAGEGAVAEGRQALGWLQEEAAVQGVEVRRRIRRGNPVRIFLELARDADLLVLGLDRWHRPFRARVADHLVCRGQVSVLLIPVLE
jgi:nucleotide-binding universal stress UspA family protein